MRSAFVFLALCLIVGVSTALPISKVGKMDLPHNDNLKINLCPTCVNLMSEAINELLQAILSGGVLGSCSSICGTLPNQYLSVACDLICDYVGVTEFMNIISKEDPDPIYICQLFKTCSIVNGGRVAITSTIVSPKSGPQGSTFNIGFNYKVINKTGPGLLALDINPPDGSMDFGASDFNDSQMPGTYQQVWQFQATPSENEPFNAGVYQVEMAVCEGDCSNSHPYGGVYAVAQTSFTITK